MTDVKDTTLLGWLKMNSSDPDAHKFKYHEIPEHYVWSTSCHKWTGRKRDRCIGLVYTASPYQGERHYLHLSLHHVSGATSCANLHASPAGEVSTTFKAAAMKLGLLDTDEEWDECLSEASISFMPQQLHSLFVTILIFGEPAKPLELWLKLKENLRADILKEALILKGELQHVHRSMKIYFTLWTIMVHCTFRMNWNIWVPALKTLTYPHWTNVTE